MEDAAVILDHGVLQGRCWRAWRVVHLGPLGGYVEIVSAARGLRNVVAVVGAILHALHAFQKAAGETLRGAIGVGRVVVVSVVGLRVAS